MAENDVHEGDPEVVIDPTQRRGVIGVLLKIRSSFLFFVLTLGVVLLVSGPLLADGVVAGMFGLWGVSLILYACLGFVFLRVIGYT